MWTHSNFTKITLKYIKELYKVIKISLKNVTVSNTLVNIKYCKYKNLNYIRSIQGSVFSDELLTQLIRPVSWMWSSGDTAITALSVTLSTSDTADIRFSALTVNSWVASLSSFGSM